MSLESGYQLNIGPLSFHGFSLAGITTSMVFKNAGVCFDVGQGLPFHMGINDFLITHGHLDHASGIPYIIAQKNMMSHKPAQFFMPSVMVEPLERIMQAWQAIEGHTYQYSFHPIEAGSEINLKPPFWARAFKTLHRVDSLGYLVYERRKKIRPELAQMSREEILKIKNSGEELNIVSDNPVAAFTGDTRIEFIESDPDVSRAQVLFMEATFWDHHKDVQNARFWGHTHFNEFLDALPRLKNPNIVLIHASARYSTSELKKILDDKCPPEHRSRIQLFERPK